MSRYYVEISMDEFKEKLLKLCKKPIEMVDYDYSDNVSPEDDKVLSIDQKFKFNLPQVLAFDPTIMDDTRKIQFDRENYECFGSKYPLGFRTLPNGMNFVGCMAGGDWEYPVHYVVYWDGKKIRGYVPTNGNTFNVKTKTAYGSEQDSDEFNEDFDFDADVATENIDYKIDKNAFEADIMARIKKR